MNAFVENPQILKAGTMHDPDTLDFKQAMTSKYKDKFIEAMKVEIDLLTKMKAWIVVDRRSLPEGANILPSTWAFKIKRDKTGEIKRFCTRFCARGDKQLEGVDVFESYALTSSTKSCAKSLDLSSHVSLDFECPC